jgi:hypothetical protein
MEEHIAPNAVRYKIDGVLTYVSDPCCGIVFAERWMGIVFGVVELAVLLLPIAIAFFLGLGKWRFLALLFVLSAPPFILVPRTLMTLWGLGWVFAVLAVWQRRQKAAVPAD